MAKVLDISGYLPVASLRKAKISRKSDRIWFVWRLFHEKYTVNEGSICAKRDRSP